MRPNVIRDNPEPHRFAQVLGGTVVTLGTLALLAGSEVAGWGLIAVVIGLASLNLFALVRRLPLYYWLNRAGRAWLQALTGRDGTMIERLALFLMLAGLALIAYAGFPLAGVARLPIRPRRSAAGAAAARHRRCSHFTTPSCAPCRFQQRPAIAGLLHELGDRVQVIVDAQEQPDAAARWGVLSVPTTFILDRTGRPRACNNGVAGLDRLRQQLMSL